MDTKKYSIIGVMSGTSLDGLDVALCEFVIKGEQVISYSITQAETFVYSDQEKQILTLMDVSALQFAASDFQFGRFIGEKVAIFLKKYQLQADFVASHGHTIFHQPGTNGFTTQIGNGAAISATCGLPVVSDFRTMDVALGGQGAPLVSIGDLLLFKEYEYCLNLGGIANISTKTSNGIIAFDICPINIPMNYYSFILNLPYDKNGDIARSGTCNSKLLAKLNSLDFYTTPAPKSLGKEWVDEVFFPILKSSGCEIRDVLATLCQHMAIQIASQVNVQTDTRILVTGGGAFNTFLIELIQKELGEKCRIVVPDAQMVGFKEALIFAFLGLQRILNKPNGLKSVTGAEVDNIGGALYGDFSILLK